MSDVTLTQLSPNLKQRFGQIQLWQPEFAILQDTMGAGKGYPFKVGDSTGRYFQEPLETAAVWAQTFAGGTPGSETLRPGTFLLEDVQVYPCSLYEAVNLSYAGIYRAGDSSGQSPKAFESTIKLTAIELAKATRRALEIGMLCGRDGVGTVESADDSAKTVTVTEGSVRSGLYPLLVGTTNSPGAILNFTNGTSTTACLQVGAQVSAWDPATRKLSFSNTPTLSSVTAGARFFLASALGAVDSSGVPTSTTITYKEQIGLRSQITTTTGTVFNVDKTNTNSQGNVVPNSGPMSVGVVTNLARVLFQRGFIGRMNCFMSPKAWSVINQRYLNLQTFNQQSPDAASMAKLGSEKFLITEGAVQIDPIPHPFMADGEIMMVPKAGGGDEEYILRVGSTFSGKDAGPDISFVKPGTSDTIVWDVANTTAVQMQCMTDQQIYLRVPAYGGLATGITYAA